VVHVTSPAAAPTAPTAAAAPGAGTGVIALWAHPRALSTAFTRMMRERGDLTVVHEPLVALHDTGEMRVPAPGGGEVAATSPCALLGALNELGAARRVFFKDTLEYRYQHPFDHPADLAGMTHTFLIRDPRRAISSHYAIKPTVTCEQIGYEHQWELFLLARAVTGREPVVIHAEDLLTDPAGTVAAYCAAAGLPFRPEALTWAAGDAPEWLPNSRWHVDVGRTTGFAPIPKDFAVTVDNDARLRRFYDYHLPFYRQLAKHALAPGSATTTGAP
jgi:hypothetical protein